MASTKRKDSKDYALKVGECQRKDGRYSYSYTDRRGKRHTVYEKSLVHQNKFKGWVPVITVLLGTGMRIGECLGLRWEDVDFEKRIISVNHNLTDRPVGKDRKCERHIQPETHLLYKIL